MTDYMIVVIICTSIVLVFLVLKFLSGSNKKRDTYENQLRFIHAKKEPYKDKHLNDFLLAYVFQVKLFEADNEKRKSQKLLNKYHVVCDYLKKLESTPIYDDELEYIVIAVSAYNCLLKESIPSPVSIDVLKHAIRKVVKVASY